MSSIGASNAARLFPGCRLDRYDLLLPMAEGGMAQLWLARQQGKHAFDKVVALKTISPQFALDSEFQQMFLDEARVVSSLTHPNVAQVLDLGEESGVLFLVMEWIDGESLINLHRATARVEEGRIPLGILLRIMTDACTGLHAAHELTGEDGMLLNIVHRDISPHNVLVGFNGTTKVIDFGIAKARNRSARDTEIGVLKGRIPYMAPEQALGLAVDRRTDVWSAGATMYRLLVGRVPYSAPDAVSVLRRIVQGEAPLGLPTTIPEPIRAVVDRALARDPGERFKTADEMRGALEYAMRQAEIQTSHQEVARFMAEHLGESRAIRAREIEHALRDSRARMRMQPRLDSGSGQSWAIPSSGLASQSHVPRVPQVAASQVAPQVDTEGAARSVAIPSVTKSLQDDGKTTVRISPREGAQRPVVTMPQTTARMESVSIPIPLRLRRPRVMRVSAWTLSTCVVGVLLIGAFLLRGSSHSAFDPRLAVAGPTPAPTASFAVEPGAQSSLVSIPPLDEVRAVGPSESPPPANPNPPVVSRGSQSPRAEPQERVSSPELLDRAREARHSGRMSEAANLFAAAVAQEPTNSEAWTGLADVQQAQGATALAVANYRGALAVNPRYLPAHLGLADALWNKGQRSEAQGVYRNMVEQFPARLLPDRVRERGVPSP